jgi:hypothetical protein
MLFGLTQRLPIRKLVFMFIIMVVSVFCTGKNRVVKIARSSFEMVL